MDQLKAKIHFIAIGGSIMHSLAIALSKVGYQVSGSDDEIYEPSKTNLEKHGLLPKNGWDPDKITSDLEAVILGMHAKEDNPELKKAKELGLPVLSFPDYIFKNSIDKQRVVIAGSHGKTTITSIITHILNYWKRDFDYAIGAAIPGLDNQIKLSDAPLIIIEGDEYFSSAEDKTSKFLKYQHHIVLISGIAWDHINAFPDIDIYTNQFDKLADSTPKAGALVYCEEDSLASIVGTKERNDVKQVDYGTPRYEIIDGKYCLFDDQNIPVPVNLIGRHNMQNIDGALKVLLQLGITKSMFFEAIQTFEGAWKRLELVAENDQSTVYTDYAHAPSKVSATIEAVSEFHPRSKIYACLELHTYSSLNKDFISQYKNKFALADEVYFFINPKAMALKNIEITKEEIQTLTGVKNSRVFTNKEELSAALSDNKPDSGVLLFMSSGNFNGLDLKNEAVKFTS